MYGLFFTLITMCLACFLIRDSVKKKRLKDVNGALEGIRTPDLPLRRGTLYPAELRAHL